MIITTAYFLLLRFLQVLTILIKNPKQKHDV